MLNMGAQLFNMSNKIVIEDPRFLPTKKKKKKISKKLFKEMNSDFYDESDDKISFTYDDESLK